MRYFNSRVFLAAAFCAASVGAAEYRFEVQGSGTSFNNWAITGFDSTNMVPAEPEAPAGWEVSYPAPPGSDSVTLRHRQEGLRGRTCLSCTSGVYAPWLAKALAAAPFIPDDAQGVDTQQVTVDGESRAYITASRVSASQGDGSFSTAFLEGIGPVYHSETGNEGTQSQWSSSVRLLEYNGINIDTLWGDELPAPTSIVLPARHEAAPRIGPRRFDLQEMGIFLGRKSALKAPLPETR